MEFFLYSFKRKKNFAWTIPFLIIPNEIGERSRDAQQSQDDSDRLGLITFVNTLVEIVVISPPFHEAKIVK